MLFRETVVLINDLLLAHVTMAAETLPKLTKRQKCWMLRGDAGFQKVGF